MKRNTVFVWLVLWVAGCAAPPSHDPRIRLVNRIDLTEFCARANVDAYPRCIAVTSDGRVFLGTGELVVCFRVDAAGRASRPYAVPTGLEDEPFGIDIAPNGTRLAVGSGHGVVHVLDLDEATTSPNVTNRRTIRFSDDLDHCSFMVAWRNDASLLVYDRQRDLLSFDASSGAGGWIADTGSGYLATSHNRRFVIIPSLTPRESVVLDTLERTETSWVVPEEYARITQFGAVSDDGQRAAIGRYRHDAFHVWRADRDEILTFGVPGDPAIESEGLAFVPESHWLVVNWGPTMFLVDSTSGAIADRCELPDYHGTSFFGPAWGMKFFDGGRRLLLLASRRLYVLDVDVPD